MIKVQAILGLEFVNISYFMIKLKATFSLMWLMLVVICFWKILICIVTYMQGH